MLLKLTYYFICIAEYLIVQRLILLVRMIQSSKVEFLGAHPEIMHESLILGITSYFGEITLELGGLN